MVTQFRVCRLNQSYVRSSLS